MILSIIIIAAMVIGLVIVMIAFVRQNGDWFLLGLLTLVAGASFGHMVDFTPETFDVTVVSPGVQPDVQQFQEVMNTGMSPDGTVQPLRRASTRVTITSGVTSIDSAGADGLRLNIGSSWYASVLVPWSDVGTITIGR